MATASTNGVPFSILLVVCATVWATVVHADPIGPGDFRNPVVEEFSDLHRLGLANDPFEPYAGEDPYPTPLYLRAVTYTTSEGTFRYGNVGVPEYNFGALGAAGPALLNSSDQGYFDVIFDQPAIRAGGWVAASAGPVLFYDRDDVLLGTVSLSLEGHPVAEGMTLAPQFAGWAYSGGIRRIRFTDAMVNGKVLILDRVTSEQQAPVPEPGTMSLLGTGLVGAIYRFRCRKRAVRRRN